MKLIFNDNLVAENVSLKDLDDLDFRQNIELLENDDSFLKWIVVDDGAEIRFCCATDSEGKPQSTSIDDLEGNFDFQTITNAFKSFFVQDQQWLKQFQWTALERTIDDLSLIHI